MMMSVANFIKRLVELDAIWGPRAKKASGIIDGLNLRTEVFTFAPGVITFAGPLPQWCKLDKFVRITSLQPHPNANKKMKITAILGPNSIAVQPQLPPDTLVAYTGLSTVSGRIWEVVGNLTVCRSDLYGNTVYNTQKKIQTNGDGGDVSLAQFDHYHGEIVTHEFNQAGTPLMTYDPASGTHIPGAPMVVIDNDGRVVVS